MVTIPKSLQPPTRTPTVAEQKAPQIVEKKSPIITKEEQRVEVESGPSGEKIKLTISQENEARELAAAALEKGSTIGFYGRSPDVRARAEYLFTKEQTKAAILGERAREEFAKIPEFRPVQYGPTRADFEASKIYGPTRADLDMQIATEARQQQLLQELVPSEEQRMSIKPEEKKTVVQKLQEYSIIPSLKPIKERVSQVKDWYTKTGEGKAVMVDIVDDNDIPTGQKVLVYDGDLTKKESVTKTIKESKFYKKLTMADEPEMYRRGAATALGLAGIATGVYAAPYAGTILSKIIPTTAKGIGLYSTGTVIQPTKEEVMYGTTGIIGKGVGLGLYGLGAGLKTAGEFTFIGPGLTKVATKLPTTTKIAGTALTGLYGYTRGKQIYQEPSITGKLLYGAEIVGETAVFAPELLRARRARIQYKKEFKSYNNAIDELNSLKRSMKYADVTTQGPSITVGTLSTGDLSLIERKRMIDGLINLKFDKKIPLVNIAEIEVKQSYNQVFTRVPKMKKIPVPKTSKLYKTQKNIYQVVVEQVVKYKNVVTYEIVLKDGKRISSSVVSFSDKPISRFRTIENAIKYGRGKKVVVSETIGDDFVGSALYGVRGDKTKKLDMFISKKEPMKFRGKDVTGVVTKKVGKIKKYEPGIGLEDLYKVSPEAGRAFKVRDIKPTKRKLRISTKDTDIELAGQRYLIGERGASRTRKVVSDTSLLNKLVLEKEQYLSKVKTERIKRLTKSQRKKAVEDIEESIKIVKERIATERGAIESESGRQLLAQKTESVLGTGVQVTETLPIFPTTRVRKIAAPKKVSGVTSLLSGVVPAITQISRADIATGTRTLLGTKTKQEKEQDKKALMATFEDSALITSTDSAQKTGTKEAVVYLYEQAKTTTPQKATVTPSILVYPDITTEPPPSKPKPTKPIKPILDFEFEEEITRKQTKVGYDVFVKAKKKFKKINTRPHTKRSALSLGAEVVDNTTSAQFKVVPRTITKKMKGKKERVKSAKLFKSKDLVDNPGYYQPNKNKFRETAIRKKREIITPNKFIEKKGKRIDTRGEKRGLSIGRYLSYRTAKPKRKKKNVKKRRTPFGF